VQANLGDLGTLMGVTGSFVCGRDGSLLGRAMPPAMDDSGLAAFGRSVMQSFNGLEVDLRGRASEFDLVFKQDQPLVENMVARARASCAADRRVSPRRT